MWFWMEGKKDGDVAKNGRGWRVEGKGDEDGGCPMSAKEMEEADVRNSEERTESKAAGGRERVRGIVAGVRQRKLEGGGEKGVREGK